MNIPSESDKPQLPVKKTKKGVLRIALVIAGVGLLTIILCAVGARLYYNDNILKDRFEKILSAKLEGDCKLEKLNLNILTGTCELKGFRLIAGEDKGGEFLRIAEVIFNIDYLKSIFGRKLSATTYIDGFSLNIIRMRINAATEDEENKYTTNIHSTLADVVRMPWKKWVGNVNWMLAQGEVVFERGMVQLEDKTGLLGSCSFNDINLKLLRGETQAAADFSFTSSSPNSQNGRFYIKINADVDQTHGDRSKQLSFITDLKISSGWQELDVPYILRYYGLGSHGQIGWLPGSPLDGNITVSAPQMSESTISAEVSTPNAVSFLENGTPVPGASPLKILLSGKMDFSNEWTFFNPLQLKSTIADCLTLDIAAQGSLEENLTFNIDSSLNTDTLSQSPLGQVLKFGKNINGTININSFIKWNRNDPLKFKVDSSAGDLVFNTPEGKIPAALKINSQGSIFLSTDDTIEKCELSLNLKTDAINIESKKPLLLSFAQNDTSEGEIFCNIDFSKLSSNLAIMFKAWGISPINEILAGLIRWDNAKRLYWKLSLQQAGNPSDPLSLIGETDFFSADKFKFSTSMQQEQTGLLFLIKGDGEKSKDGFELSFLQQLSANLNSIMQLSNRFSSLTGNWQNSFKNVRGTVREGAKGRLAIHDNAMTIAIDSNTILENSSFTVDNFPWDEKKGSLSSSLVFSREANSISLKLDSLKLRTSTANINAKIGMLKTTDLNGSLEKALQTLPEFEITASVGPLAFLHLSKLAGDKLPLILRDGKLLQLQADTKGKGAIITINSMRYESKHASLQMSPFNFDPSRMCQAVASKNTALAIKSFSPFSFSILCSSGFWNGLNLPKGLRFNGLLKAAAVINPSTDILDLRVLSFEGNKNNAAVIGDLEATATVTHLSNLIENPDINSLVLSLPKGISIPKARFSIESLKALTGDEQSSSMRALQGKEILLSKIILKPQANKSLALSGNITSKLEYYSKDSKWPLLAINGTLSLPVQQPVTLLMSPGGLSVKGTVDFTGTNIKFSALNPFVYKKAKGISSTISFSLNRQNDGSVSVDHAQLTGGPLDVRLNSFSLIPMANKEFILKLANCQIGQPFNLALSNLLLSKPDDKLTVNVATSGIDLSRLERHLTLAHPVHFSGSLGPTTLVLNDSYRKYFGGRGTVVNTTSSNSQLILGKLDLNISSATSGIDANFGISLDGGNAQFNSGNITLNGLTVKKPNGFNYDAPVSIKTISITPDMSTLFSDSLIINNLTLDGLTAVLELAFGSTNINALQKNLDKLFPKHQGTNTVTAGESRKTTIKEFQLNGGMVKLSQTLLMGQASIPVPLPPLRLTNIGGSTAGSAFSLIFDSLFDIIGKTGVGLLKNIGGAIGNIGKDVTKTIGNTIEKTLRLPFGGNK